MRREPVASLPPESSHETFDPDGASFALLLGGAAGIFLAHHLLNQMM
jgi:hypothetical protein